jgi:hypothetical protein
LWEGHKEKGSEDCQKFLCSLSGSSTFHYCLFCWFAERHSRYGNGVATYQDKSFCTPSEYHQVIDRGVVVVVSQKKDVPKVSITKILDQAKVKDWFIVLFQDTNQRSRKKSIQHTHRRVFL